MIAGFDASAQARAMADPARVQVLHLVMSDPRGGCRAKDVSATNPGGARDHLRALVGVGLLEEAGPSSDPLYVAAADAYARFGHLLAPLAAAPPKDRHAAFLQRITEALVVRHEGTFSAQTIEHYVQESYDLLAQRARVVDHLPVLTARFAEDRLSALARGAARADGTVDVLFVCVRNTGRSQIAAAIARRLGPDRLRVRTAGSSPADRVSPQVAALLAQRGWDVVLEFPKPLTDEVVRGSDFVITMGCGDACPVYPGKTYRDWPVPDPAGKDEQQVTDIVTEIEARVRDLISEIARYQDRTHQ